MILNKLITLNNILFFILLIKHGKAQDEGGQQMAQIKENDETLKEETNMAKPDHHNDHNKCRSEHPPSSQGLGHGCELIITILCDLHCTSEIQKSKGYTSGLCKPFDPICYCKC
ncbi:hypothetical protein ACQ4LE_002458 [Meloidogyne hapla]